MPYQVIYSSRESSPMSSPDLKEILDDARAGNAARGVTGVLIYVEGVFLQILEGDRDVVDALVDSIRADSRHVQMTVFHAAETAERAFADWRMAYLNPSAAEMADWAGLDGSGSLLQVVDRLNRDPRRVPRIMHSIVNAIATHSPRGRGRSGSGHSQS